ncbi:MAG: ribonuclease HII [Bacteroidota bacterium]
MNTSNLLTPRVSDIEWEAGIDEAGRGCLAGPVVAAAVILPLDFQHPQLTDSKKLTVEQRNLLRPIIEKEALAWAVGTIEPARIDEINILQATYEAMHQAVDGLSHHPAFLAIDGNRFKPYPDVPHACIVKGDSKYLHIAAASVLAKTHRDAMMEALHEIHPHYGWDSNKGYPTVAHKKAIQAYGPTDQHRRSFNWTLNENGK